MDLRLARRLTNEKPKNITLAKIEEALEKEEQKFFYFDKENLHKDIIALVEHFRKRDLSVYHRIIKYSLDANDFIYEVHIL